MTVDIQKTQLHCNMSARISQRSLGHITMPIGANVQVKFREWKYFRLGRFHFDPQSGSYIFTQLEGKKPYTRTVSSADPPEVYLNGQHWDVYQEHDA